MTRAPRRAHEPVGAGRARRHGDVLQHSRARARASVATRRSRGGRLFAGLLQCVAWLRFLSSFLLCFIFSCFLSTTQFAAICRGRSEQSSPIDWTDVVARRCQRRSTSRSATSLCVSLRCTWLARLTFATQIYDSKKATTPAQLFKSYPKVRVFSSSSSSSFTRGLRHSNWKRSVSTVAISSTTSSQTMQCCGALRCRRACVRRASQPGSDSGLLIDLIEANGGDSSVLDPFSEAKKSDKKDDARRSKKKEMK